MQPTSASLQNQQQLCIFVMVYKIHTRAFERDGDKETEQEGDSQTDRQSQERTVRQTDTEDREEERNEQRLRPVLCVGEAW